VNWEVSVSFLVSVIFGNIVKIISSDDDGLLHLCGDDDTLEDFPSNGDVAGEGAFFINICGFDSLLGSSEPETDVLEISNTGGGFFRQQFFRVQEDVFLFLEGSFVLN
jgi:hypothetical protein